MLGIGKELELRRMELYGWRQAHRLMLQALFSTQAMESTGLPQTAADLTAGMELTLRTVPRSFNGWHSDSRMAIRRALCK
jgi:hypothetical protein